MNSLAQSVIPINSSPTSPTSPASPAPSSSPSLQHVIDVFQSWLHLPDTGALEVTLATYVANRLAGDPVWLLLVGGSSGGKTEVLNSFLTLPKVVCASTITEAALISGTERKKRAKDATGGLLRKIGDFGILALKDFTSVFSMNRDTKNATLAALREIHDGKWERPLGAEGGQDNVWKGKMGLLAGCTGAVDSEHAAMAELGPRFLYFRLPKSDDPAAEEQAVCEAALSSSQREIEMRSALETAVREFTDHIDYDQPAIELSGYESAVLMAISQLSVRCRSHVERDGYRREIQLIPASEGPARFLKSLAQLCKGLAVIGVDPDRRLELIRKIALDSTPPVRRMVLDSVIARPSGTTSEIVRLGTQYPEMTIRRALEDLLAHGVVEKRTVKRTVLEKGEKKEKQVTLYSLAPRWKNNPVLSEVLTIGATTCQRVGTANGSSDGDEEEGEEAA